MKRLEVRCCCDPSKLLGHITHPSLQELGDRYVMVYEEFAGTALAPVGFEPDQMVRHRLELTVDRCTLQTRTGVRTIDAVKNHDYALEELMRVPGFEPLKDEPEAPFVTFAPELASVGPAKLFEIARNPDPRD